MKLDINSREAELIVEALRLAIDKADCDTVHLPTKAERSIANGHGNNLAGLLLKVNEQRASHSLQGETSMKEIRLFEAEDGTKFTDPEACQKYEAVASIVQGLLGNLKPRPRDFPSSGYLQQDREACLMLKRRLVEIARTLWNPEDFPVLKQDADKIHPFSALGRLIGDGAPQYLGDAWDRVRKINWDTFREYEQPYFALNPTEAPNEINKPKRKVVL